MGVAADQRGFALNAELGVSLRAAGHEIEDYGASELTLDDDYSDFIIPLARDSRRPRRPHSRCLLRALGR